MEGTPSVLCGQMQGGFSYLYPPPPAVRRLQKFLCDVHFQGNLRCMKQAFHPNVPSSLGDLCRIKHAGMGRAPDVTVSTHRCLRGPRSRSQKRQPLPSSECIRQGVCWEPQHPSLHCPQITVWKLHKRSRRWNSPNGTLDQEEVTLSGPAAEEERAVS